MVLISHGFAGSQQLMQSFALSLARNGYLVVTFDYYGHGRHPQPLRGDVAKIGGATQKLLEQTAPSPYRHAGSWRRSRYCIRWSVDWRRGWVCEPEVGASDRYGLVFYRVRALYSYLPIRLLGLGESAGVQRYRCDRGCGRRPDGYLDTLTLL